MTRMEEWRAVPGYENGYEVSSLGRVRSWRVPGHANHRRKTPRLMKAVRKTEGYLVVTLHRQMTEEQVAIHRLVLMAFVGPQPSGTEGAHYDGDPSNNRLSNLRWATYGENQQDRRRHGRLPMGARVYNAKLDEKKVGDIRSRYAAGRATGTKLAREYGVSHSVIYRVINRRGWAHVA